MIYLAVPSLSRDEMLAAIAEDLGLETTGANTTKLIRMLQEKLIAVHASGKQVVALIDEAHAIPLATSRKCACSRTSRPAPRSCCSSCSLANRSWTSTSHCPTCDSCASASRTVSRSCRFRRARFANT